MKILRVSTIGLVAFLLASAATAHDTLAVGRSATNQLMVVPHFENDPLPLPESVFQKFEGYAAPDPGFEAIETEDLDAGLFPMSSAANVQLILLAADDGIQLYNGLTPMTVGESMTFGNPIFHVHPIWNALPGTVPGQLYHMTFRLHDSEGIYTDSEEFTLVFSPVPEPATALTAAGLALAGLRRRR